MQLNRESNKFASKVTSSGVFHISLLSNAFHLTLVCATAKLHSNSILKSRVAAYPILKAGLSLSPCLRLTPRSCSVEKFKCLRCYTYIVTYKKRNFLTFQTLLVERMNKRHAVTFLCIYEFPVECMSTQGIQYLPFMYFLNLSNCVIGRLTVGIAQSNNTHVNCQCSSLVNRIEAE